jgi:hypothetical protein
MRLFVYALRMYGVFVNNTNNRCQSFSHKEKPRRYRAGYHAGLEFRNKQTTSPAIFVFVKILVSGCEPYQGEKSENTRPRH